MYRKQDDSDAAKGNSSNFHGLNGSTIFVCVCPPTPFHRYMLFRSSGLGVFEWYKVTNYRYSSCNCYWLVEGTTD